MQYLHYSKSRELSKRFNIDRLKFNIVEKNIVEDNMIGYGRGRTRNRSLLSIYI